MIKAIRIMGENKIVEENIFEKRKQHKKKKKKYFSCKNP
jgi:hypothetical protein